MCEEQLSDKILDSMSEGVIRLDAAGVVVYVNRAACEIIGYRFDEFVGMNFQVPVNLEICNEDGFPVKPDNLGIAIALRTQKSVRNLTIGIRRPDRPRVWLNVNADPLFDEAGNLTGAQAVFSDMTDTRNTINSMLKAREDIDLAIRTMLKVGPQVPLKPYQIDILRLVALGHSNKEIADKLNKAESTIRTTISEINKALGTKTRQLPLYAFRRGIANIHENS